MNRQVFVKASPAGRRVSSGMVTSSSRMACALQSEAEVGAGAVVPISPAFAFGADGVAVGGRTSAFVGGRVEVTKRGAEGVSVCMEMDTQDVIHNESRQGKIIFFVIMCA